MPQNVPSSGEDEVGKCEAPDASKGQAMTSPAKRRTRNFIAVDLMGSFESFWRGLKVLAHRPSPPNVAKTCRWSLALFR